MKCLQRYNWVKLPRNALPTGKGFMGAWMRLASRAAFRKGMASYCGYENAVEPGMWAGGVVGLKSILGVGSRSKALETLDKLAQFGYFDYAEPKRKDDIRTTGGPDCGEITGFHQSFDPAWDFG